MQLLDEILIGDEKLIIKELSLNDIGNIANLCQKASDYFILVDKKEPDEKTPYNLLTDLPEGKGLEDKYFLGIYSKEENILLAVLDLIKDYYTEGEWIIGLLLIDPKYRKKGFGRGIHNYVKSWLENHKAHLIRVAVLHINKKALLFWTSLGYNEARRVHMEFGGVNEEVIVMELPLGSI